MKRENSASSDMSKLLSFGYLDASTQSAVDNRKSSAGTGYQSSAAAGSQATTQRSDPLKTTEYQADNSLQR